MGHSDTVHDDCGLFRSVGTSWAQSHAKGQETFLMFPLETKSRSRMVAHMQDQHKHRQMLT